jgi:predicted  nucleic acid-binding Zn-ribbon protein
MTALETLLDVQDRDMAIDRLELRKAGLPERRELAGIEERLRRLSARRAELEDLRSDAARRQETLDAEVEATGERIKAIERRMYGGEVSASRELQAMSEEVGSLQRRRSQLEDREVEAMEVLEPLDAELARVAGEAEGLEAQAARTRESIRAAEESIDSEIAVEAEARSALVAQVPGDLADRYERLRRRLGGVGAARLVNGSCQGCHLSLPSAELERVRRAPPGSVQICEQCGRILVPVD